MSFSYRLHATQDFAIIESTDSAIDVLTIEHPARLSRSIRQRRLFAIRNGSALIARLERQPPVDWARLTDAEDIAVFLSDLPLAAERDYTEPPAVKGIPRTAVLIGLKHWRIAPAADRFDVSGFTRQYDGIALPLEGQPGTTRSWLPSELEQVEQKSFADFAGQFPHLLLAARNWLETQGYRVPAMQPDARPQHDMDAALSG